jgi:hypothetical protein
MIYLTERIQKELDYFKRLHETFAVQLGNKSCFVKDVDDKVLYMLLSASLSIDTAEEEFFESFVITDKSLTNKNELLIDAYALIDTDDSKEKHLHVFQYKLYEDDHHAASPREVYEFATLINDLFLHPELNQENNNEVIIEMQEKTKTFLAANRRNKIKYKCHFINNAKGETKANEKDLEILNRFNYDKETSGFDIQIYGIKEIEDLAIEGKIQVGKENINIENDNPNAYRYENNTSKTGLGLPGQTIVAMVNVNELIRLQNKYHRNQLYSENIRLYLGDRAVVNKDIISTITADESQWFPYMNNGISIICDKLVFGTPRDKHINVELENMQIINGCQTVNALYNAKYGVETKDNFKASKVLVKLYQINPDQERFKLAIIKATNNQNAVKTSALVANDPIQIAIQKKLQILGYLYDRKGEAKAEKREDKVVNMVNAALAYRAVFWHLAQQLRASIGQGRVFKNEEYKKMFNTDTLDDDNQITRLSVELLISSLILDKIRLLINKNFENYIKELPIIKKSLYYLSGLYYSLNKNVVDKLINDVIDLVIECIPQKIKNFKEILSFEEKIVNSFDGLVKSFSEFYKTVQLDKTDIDNLLKSSSFGKSYVEEIEKIEKINNKDPLLSSKGEK